jgi:hypothetical protein
MVADPADENPWAEEEYVKCLAHERHMFAWCLVNMDGCSPESAERQACERYPYKPSEDPHRGLIFHDEAWHWASLRICGDFYWLSQPGSESPSPEYRSESARFETGDT